MLQEMVVYDELNPKEWQQYRHKWMDPYTGPIRTLMFSGDNEWETMNYFEYLIELRDMLNEQYGSDRYVVAYKPAKGLARKVKEIAEITLMERVFKEEETSEDTIV